MNIPFVVTDKTATLYVAGEPFTVDRDTETFKQLTVELAQEFHDVEAIKALLKGYEDALLQVQDTDNEGRVSFTRRGVYYDDVVVHSALAQRILDIAQSGLPVDPWIRFMEKAYQNPAEFAREELYLWIEGSDLPITEDGDFLAYKRVDDDYKDLHSHTFDNSPGQVVELPGGRTVVDPDRNNTCSVGLHFCSKSYLPSFGSDHGNKVVLLKINPADVVSIPKDYNNAKGRTFRYEVLSLVEDYKSNEWAPIVSDDGNPFRFDPQGFDVDGYDANGYDRNGVAREEEDDEFYGGYDANGHDEDGYDSDGYDSDGNDRDDNEADEDAGAELADPEPEAPHKITAAWWFR